GAISSVIFSPNSKLLASASANHAVRPWDTATGRLHQTLWGHNSDVTQITFSHNSELLASAPTDYDMQLWESC
ncbi:WD40-repeat-containing domain protein, partial [Xylaria flabelliformis]